MLLAFSITFGEFLMFGSMVLMILVNMGQLTQNIVARHLYVANLDLRGLNPTAGIEFTTNVSLPLQEHQGLRRQYYWGLYSVCAGQGTSGTRVCTHRSFANEFGPFAIMVGDSTNVTALPSLVPSNGPGKLQDTHWLHLYSRVGFYFWFVGTILTGLTFLLGLASEGTFFLLTSAAALVTGAVLAVGAGMWTAVVSEARKTVHNTSLGLEMRFGQSLWMAWAATGAALAAFFPFFLGFLLARKERRLYDDRTYDYSYDDDYDTPKLEPRPSLDPSHGHLRGYPPDFLPWQSPQHWPGHSPGHMPENSPVHNAPVHTPTHAPAHPLDHVLEHPPGHTPGQSSGCPPGNASQQW